MKLSKIINANFRVFILILFIYLFVIFSAAEDSTFFSENEQIYNLSYVYYEVVEYFENNYIKNYSIGIDESNNRIIVEVHEENYVEITEYLNNKYGQMIYVINTDLELNKTNTYYVAFVYFILFFILFLLFIFFYYLKKNKTMVKITNEGQLLLNDNINISIINEIKSCKVRPNDSLYNEIIKKIEEVKNDDLIN